MTALRRCVGWWLAWFAVISLLLMTAHHGQAARSGERSLYTPSTCELERKGMQTISNRMISTRTSFRNGAKEIRFLRAESRNECSNWCCSYDDCDTVMYIGPKAFVWRSRTRVQVATEENCALLACNHLCVVDGGEHEGIYISKVTEVPFGGIVQPEDAIQSSRGKDGD